MIETSSQIIARATKAVRQVGCMQPVETVDVLKGGLMNVTVRLRGDGLDVCVRLRGQSMGPSSQVFAAERFICGFTHVANLNCAPLMGYIDFGDGWRAAVFQTVAGHRFDDLPDGNAKVFASRNWGADLARLHATPCQGFGTLLEQTSTCAKDFVCDLMLKECGPLDRICTDLSTLFEITVRRVAGGLGTRQPSYVHGDVHARNIIVHNGTVHWLDWEACRRRLPEFDFAQLPFTTWTQPALRDAFVAGYISRAHQPLDPALLHLVQVYWHIRFGLFLESCRLPIDTVYFGTSGDHIELACGMLASGPSPWTERLS